MLIKSPADVLAQREIWRAKRKQELLALVNEAVHALEMNDMNAQRIDVPRECREHSKDVVARFEREGWRCYVEQSTDDIIIMFPVGT